MRVRCTLPNASDEISGVKFAAHASGGKVSEEISEQAAAVFLSIPGYEAFDQKPPPVGGGGADGETEEQLLARLRARGVELGIAHAEQMGAKRLQAEIPLKEKELGLEPGAAVKKLD